jgi:hypothetical protein
LISFDLMSLNVGNMLMNNSAAVLRGKRHAQAVLKALRLELD